MKNYIIGTNLPLNYTIEQYQEWLYTNPPMGMIARVSAIVTRVALNSCRRLANLFRSRASRSCIWKAGIVAEPTTGQSLGLKSTVYPPVSEMVQYRGNRMADNIDIEIGQEETVIEAIEILNRHI
jgi:hypothetical protein